MSKRRAWIGAALLAATVASPALADELERSNALFSEANKLMTQGRVAEACDKFQESYRLVPRGGALLNLGICHEQQERLLLARKELTEALDVAKREGRAERETSAREHLRAIDAKLAFLAVVAPPNAPPEVVEVRIDGVIVGRGDWMHIAVEPGRHVALASAPGFRARESTANVGKGETQAVVFDALDALTAPPSERRPPLPPPPAPEKHKNPLKTASLVTGIAGVAVGLAAGAWALERKGVLTEHCDANKICDATGASAAATGRAMVVVSTAAFAVGIVGFGAWIVLPSTRAASPGGASLGVGFGAAF